MQKHNHMTNSTDHCILSLFSMATHSFGTSSQGVNLSTSLAQKLRNVVVYKLHNAHSKFKESAFIKWKRNTLLYIFLQSLWPSWTHRLTHVSVVAKQSNAMKPHSYVITLYWFYITNSEVFWICNIGHCLLIGQNSSNHILNSHFMPKSSHLTSPVLPKAQLPTEL